MSQSENDIENKLKREDFIKLKSERETKQVKMNLRGDRKYTRRGRYTLEGKMF